MVLTRSAAAKLFPNDDPRLAAGRVVTRRAARSEPARIAAVIEDLTLSDITREPPPSIFVPLAGRYPGLSVSAFVASTGSPERLAAAARRELAQVSAELPMYDVRTARAAVDQQFAARDAMARAAATLGLIGLLLAASGLYAVLANVIAARRREFGIRSAMGAGPRRILGSVMASGFVPVFIGMVAGLAGAAGASKALKSQMFALDNFDPWSYALALVTLIAAAALACAMPAYRASRVSPAEVLRDE
jgi:predicted lysophospholipase L1 biosynthesis ABC-type transport system permease subunit